MKFTIDIFQINVIFALYLIQHEGASSVGVCCCRLWFVHVPPVSLGLALGSL